MDTSENLHYLISFLLRHSTSLPDFLKDVSQQKLNCVLLHYILPFHESSVVLHVKVRIHTTPTQMRSFVMNHLCSCEVIGPKRFRDEIQKTVLDAYKKYW